MFQSVPPPVPGRAIQNKRNPRSSKFNKGQEREWDLKIDSISDQMIKQTPAASNRNKRHDHFVDCSSGDHKLAANHKILYSQDIGVSRHKLYRQYEKLNKETLEQQIDSKQIKERSDMEDFPDQFNSTTPGLHLQSFHYMDIICQRMATIAMQQLDSWVKEKYMVTNSAVSTEEHERLQHQYHSHLSNRYQFGVSEGLQCQCSSKCFNYNKDKFCGSEHGSGCVKESRILQASSSHKNNNSSPHSTDTFSLPYRANQRPQTADIALQKHDTDVVLNPSYKRSCELRDRSADEKKNSWDVENPEQHGILPDADVNCHKETDGYFHHVVSSRVLASTHHGLDVDVDSFGLPLTVFERGAMQGVNKEGL